MIKPFIPKKMAFISQKSLVKLGCIFLSLMIGLFLPFRVVLAGTITYDSFIVKEPYKIEFIGPSAGDQFGASVASGDFNGDGIKDLAVGAPFSSTSLKEWNGAVYVFWGKKNFQPKTIDLSLSSQPSLAFFGEHSGDAFGSSLEFGDYNNDGVDDLAIGAYNGYSASAKERPGKVYVIYGKKTWTIQSFDFESAAPDAEFIGYGNKDEFGLSLKTLDINNDKIKDLLIGAPSASVPDVGNTGQVYAYFGSYKGFPVKINSLKERFADLTYFGQNKGERFGASITGGHFSDKRYTDLAVSAYKTSSSKLLENGNIYLYKGYLNNGEKYSVSQIKTPTNIIEGTENKGWFGFTLAANDLNSDGVDDLAISSLSYSTVDNNSRISVFYGGSRFAQKGLFLYDTDQFRNILIDGPVEQNYLGTSIVLNNFNDDIQPDIVIGAPGIGIPSSENEGNVYMIYGVQEKYNSTYTIKKQEMTSTIHGESADDWFGYALAEGDFNGDGKVDLIVGSRYSDSANSQNNGKVFILLNHGVPFGEGKEVLLEKDQPVTRGEFIKLVLEKFDTRNKYSDYISNCYEHLDFCFFNFMAMSNFNGIKLRPQVVLYPDIKAGSKYYDDVLVGTMLGLLNGFMNEKNSPFKPNEPISRIQALKVILSATGLVPPKYRFELVSMLGSYQNLKNQYSYFSDVDSKISRMWWYPRYTNFAVVNGVIPRADFFRPDDKITVSELNSFIENTLNFVNKQNAETKS